MNYFAITVLLACAALPDPVLLTPDSVKQYDYFFNCRIANQRQAAQADGMVAVELRFAPKRRGQFGIGAEDLDQIAKEAALVLRENNADTLRIPLRTEVDPGNYIHLRTTFAVHKDLLPKLQLRFTDRSEQGDRTFIAEIHKFLEEK